MRSGSAIAPPVEYGDWQPDEVSFGEGDGVLIETDHGRHVAAVLEALGKDGLWRPVASPLRIHTREVYEVFRLPLLLRVALYGQDELTKWKDCPHVDARSQ